MKTNNLRWIFLTAMVILLGACSAFGEDNKGGDDRGSENNNEGTTSRVEIQRPTGELPNLKPA